MSSGEIIVLAILLVAFLVSNVGWGILLWKVLDKFESERYSLVQQAIHPEMVGPSPGEVRKLESTEENPVLTDEEQQDLAEMAVVGTVAERPRS